MTVSLKEKILKRPGISLKSAIQTWLGQRAVTLIGRGPRVYPPPFTVFQQDTVVETSDSPAFKVELVNGKGDLVSDAEFQVHLCPRRDHYLPGTGTPPCTRSPVLSQGGKIESIRINASPGASDAQGYMGVELTRSPSVPGEYYIRFENLPGSNPYKVRQMGDIFWDRSLQGEGKGGWHLLTVLEGEFLDENFNRLVDPYVVDQDTLAYFRYRALSFETPPSAVTIESRAVDGVQASSIVEGLNRLGRSNVYMTGPFTLRPPPAVSPASEEDVKKSSTVLGVFAPTFELKAFFPPRQVGQADGIVNGLPIKIEHFYRGEGPPTAQEWYVLRPNKQAYLGDSLRLTPDLPAGWSPPTSYGWSFEVDGQPYTPPGLDTNAAIALVEPIQKAGLWKIKLRVFWGSVERRYERPVDVWLQTIPSVLVSWINGDEISDTLYGSSHLQNICDVFRAVANSTAAFLRGERLCPPGNWDLEDRKRATILLLKDGRNPRPPDVFSNAGELQTWLGTVYAFKFASQIFSEFPVREGVPRIEQGSFRDRLRGYANNKTKLAFPPDCIPFPEGEVTGFLGSPDSTNDTLRYISGAAGNPFEYRANGRPSFWLPQSPFVCWLETSFPQIWAKAIFNSLSPDLKTDHDGYAPWRSNFPTTWGYVPEDWPGSPARQFPLRARRINPQVPDPTAFILAPNLQ